MSPRGGMSGARTITPVAQGGLASWRPSARLHPSECYGRYEILGRIGRGGMAEILLARERALAGATRHLVIKRVLPEVVGDAGVLRMFLDEARVVMGLSHPHLCQIYEVGQQDGTWFIAMEWVNGVTLHQLIQRAFELGELDCGVIAKIAAQCAEALHHAHTARDAEGRPLHLVHRDVSPHNVMVAYDGRVKLLDFGIAKSVAATHQTDVGVVKGKIWYLAPEQWLSQPVDGRTDVFALGACMHEALSGRVLFKREGKTDVMNAAITGEVPALTEVAEHVPEELAAIVHRALAVRPADRFGSARELGDSLDRFLAGSGEPVGAARIAEYARRLFRAEVRLGPVLERAVHASELEQPAPTIPPPPRPVSATAGTAISAIPGVHPEADTIPPPPRKRSRSGPQVVIARLTNPRPSIPPPPPPHAILRRSAPAVLAAPSLPQRWSEDATVALPPEPILTLEEAFAEAPTRKGRWAAQGPTDGFAPLGQLALRVGQRLRRLALGALLAGSVPMLFAAHAAYTRVPTPVVKQLALEDRQPPIRGTHYAMLGAAARERLPEAEAPRAKAKHHARRGKRHGPVVPIAPIELTSQTTPTTLLTIEARPGTRVYLGKKFLGVTPLVRAPVPKPPLTLRLVERTGRVYTRHIPATGPTKEPRSTKSAL
ncbi:MAG: serine/threonine-protein kinase [Polyangiales bacterium]